MMNYLKVLFLGLVLIITLALGITYIVSQQLIRQSANDPQIQMAQDTAFYLKNGRDAQSLLPKNDIDIGSSLAPFLIIYDYGKKPIASSGYLDGEVPHLPPGVLDYARSNGENRITWQPTPTVRIAAIVVAYDQGFVLAGRSLREAETRISTLGRLVFLAWLISICIFILLFTIQIRFLKK